MSPSITTQFNVLMQSGCSYTSEGVQGLLRADKDLAAKVALLPESAREGRLPEGSYETIVDTIQGAEPL
ncbi:MAG TPA: hypothetical protein VN039_03350 [Nitrospira sp.]|nr:hypothetical protein [Nitrospira sp.]